MSNIYVSDGKLTPEEESVRNTVWAEVAPLIREAIGDIHLYDRGYRPSERFNGGGAHCHPEDRRLCFMRCRRFTTKALRHEAMHAGYFRLAEIRGGLPLLEAQWRRIAGQVVFTSAFKKLAPFVRFPVCGLLDAYSCELVEDIAQLGEAILSQAAGELSTLRRIKDRDVNKNDPRFFRKALCLYGWGLVTLGQLKAALPWVA